MSRLPISAIVVGRNEGQLLDECIESLSFCEEIIYADMASEDGSSHIAESLGATVIRIEPRPKVEDVLNELAGKASFPWVLHLDPDERISPELRTFLTGNWANYSSMKNLAGVALPFFYYVYRRKLRGTVWGGEKAITRLVHRDRYVFGNLLHATGSPREAHFVVQRIRGVDGREVRHLWLSNLRLFLQKHSRYIREEGPSRYNQGLRTNGFRALLVFPKAFLFCFFVKRGFLDGVTGWLLCLFWGYYQAASTLRLLLEQRRRAIQ